MAASTPKRKVEIVPLKPKVEKPKNFGDVELTDSGDIVSRSTKVERQGAQSPADLYSPHSPAYCPNSPELGKTVAMAGGDPDGVEVL